MAQAVPNDTATKPTTQADPLLADSGGFDDFLSSDLLQK